MMCRIVHYSLFARWAFLSVVFLPTSNVGKGLCYVGCEESQLRPSEKWIVEGYKCFWAGKWLQNSGQRGRLAARY